MVGGDSEEAKGSPLQNVCSEVAAGVRVRKRSVGVDALFLCRVAGEPRAATDPGEVFFQSEGSSLAEYF